MKKISFNIPGTIPSSNTFQLLVSSGNPSLDKLLGDGLPVGSLTLIEEDSQGTYARIILKYFLAEGIVNKHSILVGSQEVDPKDIVTHLPALVRDDVADITSASGDHMKIAFRYTGLPTNEPRIKHEFGHYYDLSATMTSEIMQDVDIHYWQNKDYVKKTSSFKNRSYQDLLENIKSVLNNNQYSYTNTTDRRNILKIGIYGIGSPLWMSHNDCDSKNDLNKFFICLRALLKSSLAVAVVTVPSHLYDKETLNRCVNASDVSLRLQALAGTELEHNKYLADYHGYFHIDKLAAINTFVSKHPGPIEYMFKLRRKKFTIEMLHLPPDLEVSEGKKAAPSLGCASNTRHLLEF